MTWNFKDQDKLSGGVPNRLVVRVRGAHLYDPRLDSSVGGSGPQRYDDPETWTWNDGNAALVALRYIIGERGADGELIWGVGDPVDDVDLESVIASANVADEVRDGVPRFRLGGHYPTSNDHHGFFSQWEANTGGKIARIGGKRYVWLPHDDLTPIDTITEKDVVSAAAVAFRAAQEPDALVNAARGRFIDPEQLYQGPPYPEVKEAAAMLEDGKKRVLALDFSWLQDSSIAERGARYAVRRSRFGRVWVVPLYPPFSVLTLNIAETGGGPQLVRVVNAQMSVFGLAILTLQEEDPAIYDDTAPLGPPPSYLPSPERLDRLGTSSDPRVARGLNEDGTLKTGKALTDSLAPNAATLIASAYSVGDANWVNTSTGPSQSSAILVQVVTIADPTGAPVQIMGEAWARLLRSGTFANVARLYRIRAGVETQIAALPADVPDQSFEEFYTTISIQAVDEPPTGAPVTYAWRVTASAVFTGFGARQRVLSAFEAKR